MHESSLPRLRFNCYLLRPGLPDLQHALRPKYREGGAQALERLHATPAAPAGAVAYLGTADPKTPRWAELLQRSFLGAGRVSNQANRMVVFLPVKERHFAVCFGYGSGALEWENVENSFGLRIAARRFQPDKVTELRSRRIDASARTQAVTVAAGGEMRDLGVDLEGEFVRKLVGRLDDTNLGETSGAIVAGDSIAFRSETDLHRVQQVLAGMLEDLGNTEAQEAFAFVDSLEPLRKSESRVKDLAKLLASKLLNDDVELPRSVQELDVHFLEFAPPDDVSLDEVESFKVLSGNREATFEEPSLENFQQALQEVGVRRGSSFLTNVKILALGADGGERSQALSALNWLVFEAGTAESRYVLTLGRWFRLKESYTDKLNADLKKIRVVTSDLGLPDWLRNDEEKAYNKMAASGNVKLLNLDRVMIRAEDGGQIESCDLVHLDGFLIHVKRYNGSQTLSHLFAQAAVSAELLNGDELFKERFVEQVGRRDATFKAVAERAPRVVTYAIGFSDGRDLPLGLPTFSKVNLRDEAKRLRNARVVPSLARITLV